MLRAPRAVVAPHDVSRQRAPSEEALPGERHGRHARRRAGAPGRCRSLLHTQWAVQSTPVRRRRTLARVGSRWTLASGRRLTRGRGGREAAGVPPAPPAVTLYPGCHAKGSPASITARKRSWRSKVACLHSLPTRTAGPPGLRSEVKRAVSGGDGARVGGWDRRRRGVAGGSVARAARWSLLRLRSGRRGRRIAGRSRSRRSRSPAAAGPRPPAVRRETLPWRVHSRGVAPPSLI